MDKKVLIIAGIVLLVTVVAIGLGLKNKPASKNPKANQVQTMPKDKIKNRNEALKHISMAQYKAQQGDINEAMELCDKALKLSPDEPIAKNCHEMIKHINK